MKLTVSYAGKKFDIVCLDDTYDCLEKELAKTIGVPIGSQRVIFKGKSLHSGKLSEQGLENNAKLMLIGSQTNSPDTECQAAVDSVEMAIHDLELRFDQLREDFNDINAGFVPDENRTLFLRSLVTRLMAFNDQGDRTRARLDDLIHRTELSAQMLGDRCRRLSGTLDILMDAADSMLSDALSLTSTDCAFSAD